MSAAPEITITFRRETDGRWIAFVKRWKLSITRNSLDDVRWNIWEWIRERLDSGGIEVEEVLAQELESMQVVGRVDDPWTGRKVGDSQKFIRITAAFDALQWTGVNAEDVIRFVSHTPGFVVIPAGPRFLVLESSQGRSAVDARDWLIRDSENNLTLMTGANFHKSFVPLPEKPTEGRIPNVPADQLVTIQEGQTGKKRVRP